MNTDLYKNFIKFTKTSEGKVKQTTIFSWRTSSKKFFRNQKYAKELEKIVEEAKKILS